MEHAPHQKMIISVIEELIDKGSLPNTNGETDPRIGLPTLAAIDSLSPAAISSLMQKLSADALLARIFADAHAANPSGGIEADRELIERGRAKSLR